MNTRATRIGALGLLLALSVHFGLFPRILANQSPSESRSPDQAPQTFRVGANYVRVDVYATANGTPVTDLQARDFVVLEDGRPQEVAQFELVNIRAGLPSVGRRDPSSVAEARAPVADGRERLLVLFLDAPHVDDAGSGRIRQPLLRTLERIVGESDLMAVMVPDMPVTDLTFSRRTTAIESFLDSHLFWGERDRITPADPVERLFQRCYPLPAQAGLVDELIARHRETRTFDALRQLVEHLRDVREERKAIVLISEGWQRFQPTDKFDSLGGAPPLATPASPPGVTSPLRQDVRDDTNSIEQECQRNKMALSHIDHELGLREITALANRSNSSFYAIDPRGLPIVDDSSAFARGQLPNKGNPTSTTPPPNLNDRVLRQKLDSLRTIAQDTDGLALLNSNDLDGRLRQMSDDLSSYYLLSYYSSGKLDGKFHAITVRTNRPGVSIRSRRGYLSPKLAAPTTTLAAPTPVAPDAAADGRRAALDLLAGAVRDAPARASIVTAWSTRGGTATPLFTIVGEIADKVRGGAMDVIVASIDGEPVATGRGAIAAGTGGTLVTLATGRAIAPGRYVVRVRLQDGTGTETLTIPVALHAAPEGDGAVYFKRSGATGNQETATADLRFRRSDQVRIEAPASADGSVTAQLLDRTGKPLNVPVAVAVRTSDEGARWMVARPTLAAVGAGDYLVEFVSGSTHTLAPLRVTQ